ncbi:hypothetical protein KC726_02955 [Candidatus Woesebacteria bacterium]|nr:hypothetical protein [Candidatus Woesebacteria bacterium]
MATTIHESVPGWLGGGRYDGQLWCLNQKIQPVPEWVQNLIATRSAHYNLNRQELYVEIQKSRRWRNIQAHWRREESYRVGPGGYFFLRARGYLAEVVMMDFLSNIPKLHCGQEVTEEFFRNHPLLSGEHRMIDPVTGGVCVFNPQTNKCASEIDGLIMMGSKRKRAETPIVVEVKTGKAKNIIRDLFYGEGTNQTLSDQRLSLLSSTLYKSSTLHIVVAVPQNQIERIRKHQMVKEAEESGILFVSLPLSEEELESFIREALNCTQV